jgi:hypothetical protein
LSHHRYVGLENVTEKRFTYKVLVSYPGKELAGRSRVESRGLIRWLYRPATLMVGQVNVDSTRTVRERSACGVRGRAAKLGQKLTSYWLR